MNCKLAGMELISIETKEEQEAIAEELSKRELNYMILLDWLMLKLSSKVLLTLTMTFGHLAMMTWAQCSCGTRPGKQ
jgi:hypothetical protein